VAFACRAGLRAGRTWRATMVRDNRSGSKNRHPEAAIVSLFNFTRGESRLGVRPIFDNRSTGGACARPNKKAPADAEAFE